MSQLLSKVTCHILQFLHQMFSVSTLLLDRSGRHIQAGDATDKWIDQRNAAKVCQTQ